MINNVMYNTVHQIIIYKVCLILLMRGEQGINKQNQWVFLKSSSPTRTIRTKSQKRIMIREDQPTLYIKNSSQTNLNKGKSMYKWTYPQQLIKSRQKQKKQVRQIKEGSQFMVLSKQKYKKKLIQQIQQSLPAMKTSSIIKISNIITDEAQIKPAKSRKYMKTQHIQPVSNIRKLSINSIKSQKTQYHVEHDEELDFKYENSPILKKQDLLKIEKKRLGKNQKQRNKIKQIESFENSHYNNQKYERKDGIKEKVNISHENKSLIYDFQEGLEDNNRKNVDNKLAKSVKFGIKKQIIDEKEDDRNSKKRSKTQVRNKQQNQKVYGKYKYHILADYQRQIGIQKQFNKISIEHLMQTMKDKYKVLIGQSAPQIHIYPFRISKLPDPPHYNQSIQSYMQLIRELCKHLNIQLFQFGLVIKRYHNCIYFKIENQSKVVIWNYDGRLYVGGWRETEEAEGKKYGDGIEFTKDYCYEGEFENGKRSGKGRLQYENGNYYEGEWRNGKMEGEGVFFDKHNFAFYEGTWINGKQEGKGVAKYSKKHFYIGSFNKNLRSGKGVEHFDNGDIYEGSFENDKLYGQGYYYSANGQFYFGNFKNSMKHGRGLLIYNFNIDSKQSIYQYYYGQFVNGMKSGYGIQHKKDGTYYFGYFYNNFAQGPGVLQNIKSQPTNDIKISGVWKQGKLITRSKSIKTSVQNKSSFKEIF